MKQQQRGVTLIELLIVAALIGILGAIAVPAYRDYVIRGKLTEAHSILSGTRVRMEQYYQDNKSYPTWCGGAAGLAAFTAPANTTYFTFSCAAGATAGQNYTMTATGVTGGAAGLAAFTAPANTTYFTFSCAAGATAGQNYTMTATGVAGGGTGGFTYTITEANARATTAVPTGWTSSTTCWVMKKNGSC